MCPDYEEARIDTAILGVGRANYMHEASRFCSSQLNIWDVGGQKSLRSYWRNYFEQTDAMIWVVDSADVWRLDDCRQVS